ncbi:hypothetical protein [Desulfovibrio sp. ZJ369]|uniref:hypothetical protein n=1 Tax=Desulfovibrio sp. ZJ369 TaxID=2709793 RepID=UPI0013EBD29F|nr:hypothetical protein [Desulfovibrio sp. ZJ369]
MSKKPASQKLAALEHLTRNNSVSAQIKSGQSDYDFAHEIEEARGVRRRYRGNATPVADGYSTGVKIVFRAIPSLPSALEDLHVEQGILDHAMPSNGLVLVTGVMGAGKSTLLSSRRLIVSQRLLPLPDKSGRIALREYLPSPRRFGKPCWIRRWNG